MCGIVGYLGKHEAKPILFEGLRRLEYRGYDSAGLCIISPDKELGCIHSVGNLDSLERALERIEVTARVDAAELLVGRDYAQSRRIITAVLEPAKPFKKDWLRFMFSKITNDSTHVSR